MSSISSRPPPAAEAPVAPTLRALHLFALCGLAIGQPLLDLLARYAELFVARRAEPPEVVAFALGLLLVPPAALAAIERLAAAESAWLAWRIQCVFVAALLVLLALPLASRLDALAPWMAVAAAVLAGLAGAIAYARSDLARRLVSVLAFGPLVFAGVFLTREPIRALLTGETAAIPEISVRAPAPIVFVVFDELPLATLLDARGEIDRERFPAFARLASTSTWLRNATTVESRTLQAIPAIVSGRYPSATRRLPLASQHPVTLFSLLSPSYRMNVVESLTVLHATRNESVEPASERLFGLARDVALIYAHFVLPTAWSVRMPDVRQAWRDFAAGRTDPRRSKRALRGRPEIFRQFVRTIRPGARPALNFIHSVLPHGPWQYLPTGAAFYPQRSYGRFLGVWPEESYFALEAQQRHLLQTQLVDRLLGELLDHLQATGLFERSLVVVVADHGASFWPGDHFRNFESGAHPEDILSIPLFIKRPGQTDAVVSLRNVETIDVLPSVLQVIDADAPAGLDGCSVFDTSCAERAEKLAFSPGARGSQGNRTHHFPAELGLSDTGLRRKLDEFGTGPLPRVRFGPHGDLVGRPIEALAVANSSAGTVTLEPLQRSWQLGRGEVLVPVRLVGRVDITDAPPAEPIHVAVVRNGTVAAVVPVVDDGEGPLVVALLPEADPADPADGIELFWITGTGDGRRLQRLVARE